MNDTKTFDKGFWKSFGWFLLIALVICSLPWILATHSLWIDFSDTGQIGDTIGGVMGPFVAIAAAALTFIAFWVQYKANIQQRHDIAKERFESNLFEMIHIQQEIINGLLIEEFSDSNKVKSQRGRDVFQFVYETVPHKIWIGNERRERTLKHALEISDDVKLAIPNLKRMWFLDHYYRHLYRIFKYIDDADNQLIPPNRKYEYASIVRATLSQYELIMLFYNGFYHKRFKKLIEKYAILNNLRIELLASQADINLYERKVGQQYSFTDDEGKNLDMEYKKSAFVPKKELREI